MGHSLFQSLLLLALCTETSSLFKLPHTSPESPMHTYFQIKYYLIRKFSHNRDRGRSSYALSTVNWAHPDAFKKTAFSGLYNCQNASQIWDMGTPLCHHVHTTALLRSAFWRAFKHFVQFICQWLSTQHFTTSLGRLFHITVTHKPKRNL